MQQYLHGDRFERLFMRGFETCGSDNTGIIRLLPTVDADAPMIARFQSAETVFWSGRDQVVTDGCLVLQEFIIHFDADRVLTRIFGTGVALTIAIETREWLRTAGLQDGAQNILNH